MAAAIGRGWRQCFADAARGAGFTPSQTRIEQAFLQAQGRINQHLSTGLSLPDAVAAAGRDFAGEQKLAVSLAKRDKLRNQMLAKALDGRVEPGREAQAPRTVLTGRVGDVFGRAASVDAQRHGLVAQIVGPMIADFRKAGVLKAVTARAKDLDRRVARELWRLEDPASGAPTGDRTAETIAKIIHTAQETARNLQNEAGAWIGKMDHYVVRQSHDMEKVRGDNSEAAFERWRSNIEPKLDQRTFAHLDGSEDIPEFLKETWRNISSGIHETANPDVLRGYAGPGNLAKKASAERVLHFKSADDWFDYNGVFGKGAVIDSATTGLMRAARNVALMRTFGTNPEAMYGGWIDRMMQTAKAADDGKTLAGLRAAKTSNENIMKVITGEADIPQGMSLAKVGSLVRTVETLTKLGSVVLSSLPDLAVNAATLRHQGIPLFEAYARQMTSLLPTGAATRAVADELLVGVDGLMANVMHRFHAEDGALGQMANLVDKFHKINLLTFWTDSLKEAAGLMITSNLAKNAGKEFGALDGRLQATLGRYGIAEADWNAMREVEMHAADGRDYLMPGALDHLPELKTKYSTMISDTVREGMTEPTAGTRAAVTGGMQRGTPWGESIRLLLQFKTYPATFYARTLRREGLTFGDAADRSQSSLSGVAHLIVGTSLLGYLSFTLKDLANGRKPRDPQDPLDYGKAVMRAMTQGGGLGLYGDFLFGEANHLGGGWASSLLGPAAGTLDNLGKFYDTIRDGALKGDMGHVAAGGIQFAKNNLIPNLFYTRLAMDHLVWFRLQEAANPGYLRRYEHIVEKQNAQEFWLSPTNAAR